jgi:hypothetical protein
MLVGLACVSMTAASIAVAAEKSASGAPQATVAGDAPICVDEATQAEQRRKRDAALADLGRRLAAEPVRPGNNRVLNRSGHNYGSRPVQHGESPPAKPAPDTERR